MWGSAPIGPAGTLQLLLQLVEIGPQTVNPKTLTFSLDLLNLKPSSRGLLNLSVSRLYAGFVRVALFWKTSM